MPSASHTRLSRWQSFLVGVVGVWGLVASVGTMAWGPSLWTGAVLGAWMRPDAMQCGALNQAEQLHRAAAEVRGWAGIAADEPECIAVPVRPLGVGHRMRAEDLTSVHVPVSLRAEGLRSDGGLGDVVRYSLTAGEPVFELSETTRRRDLGAFSLAPPVPR